MAQDLKTHSMVALKIGVPGDLGDQELTMQKEVLRTVEDVSRISTFLDCFGLPGPKGSESSILPIGAGTDKDERRKTITHGYLNNGTVLWDIGAINNYTQEMIYREFGRPRRVPLSEELGKTGELVMLVEFYLGQVPFMGNAITVLSRLTDFIGPLPLQWAGKYNAGGTFEDRWYLYDQPQRLSALGAKIEQMRPEVGTAERELALLVFQKVFTYLPEDRLTAAELLKDKDFNALMSIYGD
ncbi:kinase domain-containing protein [Penicillium taxi]|uniref:kinase domain-containing protein n=1 Tax=Penicillium taxi TaxID=168475 RepID=UPI00254596AA|nr:kinase domain-containing protein [Penicillium taxi]KAJ5894641.1 kinase domain-containing protein [Penicillium taxi]